ncbi:MAG: hypothetical protein EP337_00270 [Rhodobacteraceae bacterium]|nr:MAG: hypothetical protein EP337_00270 [Paracoccaceae bacterium]
MAEKYLCNLLIPGAGKSGTSSLHAALSAHPKICGSDPKEPQFFSFDLFHFGGPEAHNSTFKDDGAAEYFCDGSQCYFSHGVAIDRIRDNLDRPKIIIMLRSPVERALSQYNWNYRRGTETSSFENAVLKRGEITDYIFDERIGCFREIGGYVAFSRYSNWVPRWQEAFGIENVLIVRFDDFRDDQRKVLKKCYDFLELDSHFIDVTVANNETKKTSRVVAPSVFLFVARFFPKAVRRTSYYQYFKKLWMVRSTPIPKAPSEDFIRRLEEELRSDIEYYDAVPSLIDGPSQSEIA